ncbi:MAG TPA: P-type DNA transfer ATPase VirB11 [Steroidobacteraceae bacterium]|nr:P-type DNA transfer ATPase VirB11 [Steroidobacteraceae bacterium]
MTSPGVEGRTPDPSALSQYVAQLAPWLSDRTVTEICINRPREAFVERADGWQRGPMPFATEPWCQQFARLVASATRQRVSAEHPLLSAALPHGERVQVVLPPAVERGTVAICIRRPSERTWALGELAAGGLFDRCLPTGELSMHGADPQLAALYSRGRWVEFLQLAVRARKNIVVSGATGSGKTTLTRALILGIPREERLISVEDAAELALASHPNSVRLYYSKDAQGLARVTPRQLIEASLRMRPDRILLAELRGEEAYYYLRNVNSGHPGSITSVHASSASLAFEQLALLVKESAAGRELGRTDIRALLHELVDVVVHCALERQRRLVKEVYWKGAPA